MRPGRDADAVQLGDRQEQPDAIPHATAVRLWIGQPVGERDAMSIAFSDGHPLSVSERQPESLELALARS